jgi:hypothetical protein
MLITLKNPDTDTDLVEFDTAKVNSNPVQALCLLLYLFPAKDRDLFLLNLLTNATPDPVDLAEILSVTPATIKDRIHRAKKAFERLMKRYKGHIPARDNIRIEEDEVREDDDKLDTVPVEVWGMAPHRQPKALVI